MERVIIHSDINSCYVSIECSENPSLKGKAVAVGGNEEERHGIILAKSEQAKKYGVKTGEALWQAREKCPELIIIEPHFELYKKYSSLAREIYADYTDKIEPMGLDEAWCDLTGTVKDFKEGRFLCEKIKSRFKDELGVTVSIGLSFNKVFAKLGSDLAGRDQVYEIRRDNFKERVWPLPVDSILFVGRKTKERLKKYGILTVGQLAECNIGWLKKILGAAGEELWIFANGEDESRVMPKDYVFPVKSVGRGTTCKRDLLSGEEVWKVFLRLSSEVAKQLKELHLEATGIQIAVKDEKLFTKQFQSPLLIPSSCSFEIAKKAMEIFKKNYKWEKNVRALTVRGINLICENSPYQLDFLNDYSVHEKNNKIDKVIFEIRNKFGNDAIFNCCLMTENNANRNEYKSVLSSAVYK